MKLWLIATIPFAVLGWLLFGIRDDVVEDFWSEQ